MEALGQEHAARPWLSHPEDPGQEHAARPWLSHPEDTMEALGQEHAARPWLSHPEDPQGSTLLWKLPDCLSTFENTTTTSTFTNRPNDHMDNRKPMLELKDVPPPPHHPSSSSSSHPFPLASLPLPPPCLPAPQLPPDSYQQQQQQGGGSPKVSICTHCEHCGSTGSGEYGVSRGGVGVGNNMARSSGVLSLFMAPSSAEPLNNNNGASTFHAYPRHACHGSGGDSFDTILRSPGSYKLQLPPSSSSSVATRKPPMSAHCYLPCCTGLLHAYPSIPCSQSCLFPVPPHPHPSAPLGAASSLPSSLPSVVPTSVHTGSCLVSSACYPCGGGGSVSSACCPCGGGGGSVDYSSASQRITAAHGDHHSATTTAITTTTSSSSSSSHFYTSNPMHLNVERTVCLKGAHYCRECMLKPVNGLLPPEMDKGWPTVPLPSHQSAPIPVPMCNGCGTSSDGMLLMPPSSLGKGGHKYGSPDSGGPENIPPVGVFWDIENCHVPSGRSAGAVVQRIRSRFFQGHREAEFICVCDISKESKPVIQELNNCQVTVAHINATAKNAADDKLRQSLRRFAETHTAPATVVLVSSDVNFASELSDLRHRHGFQVILVHGSHTSPALLQHAHRHVAFADITADLPPRVPLDAQPSFNLLYVHNLPVNCDKNFRNAVKVRLRRLSDNCGGKVLGVSQGTAVLRFGSQEAAERARRRMDNEDVFGHSISLSFSPRPKDDGDDTIVPPESDHRPVIAMPLLHQSSCPFQDTGLPVRPSPSLLPFSFLPLEKQLPSRSPRRPRRRAARLCQTPVGLLMPERPYSPRRGCSGPPGGVPQAKPHHQELGGMENKPKPGFHSLDKEQQRTTGSSSPHSNGEAGATEQLPKASLIGESMYRRRRECSSPRSATDSSAERGDFHVSTPSAFSKLNLHRSFSPLVHTQGSWSPSRSASPCLSSRSSPLLAPPRSPCRSDEPFSEGADVQVTNLDYRMSRKDLQQALHDTFSRYGKVKVVELSPHTDYQLKATVQMVSLQQAISAVSGLHRYKIGGKRMQVSLITGGSNNKSLSLLSTEIISILQDAPAHCLPLFKFTEIYEKKCSRKLVVGDLYRLPEVVALRDQGGSRLLCLLPNSHMRRQSPLGGSSQSQEGGSSSASGSPVVFEELEYHEPICRHHYPQQDFSEADFDPDSYKIPFVVMSLSALASQVHSLLQAHDGTLPLLSFPECYASKFPPLQLGDETVDGGVPLEHLITCIPSITIVTAQNGFKVIKWMHSKPPALNPEPWIQRCKSPVGNPQLIQFSREIIDLLKSRPACIMPINKFIPSYHHHFAKQCRVSDYGYSKLIELLEAVPHVLQILGMGTKRLLTLTHRAQVKRFTQDLLKLLKFQASKQVAIKDFMQAYHWCFSRDWRVIDYGICDLLDLLAEIPDTTITITHQDTDTVISVPKRERTVDEVERTKQFGKEVVDLLRHQPHCRMPFSKLIPTYHHHFGRQCKLSYYGFNKLIELFEAIPDVLMVLECGEEKVLTLTEVERIKALAAQLVKLLRSQRNSSLPVTALLSEYSKTFGYGLRLHDYDASSLPALMAKLCHVVKVVDGPEGREVQLINRKSLRALTCQLLALLMSLEERQSAVGLKVEALSQRYLAAHKTPLNPCEYGFLSLSELLKSLPYLVELYYEDTSGPDSSTPPPYGGRSASGREEWVRLTKLYQFARNVRALLHTYHYNQIFLTEFAGAYGKFTGCSLQPRAFGYASTDELLSAIPQVVWIKGHSHKRIIVLKNDMKAKACSAASDSPLLEENNNDSLSSDANSRTHSPAPGAPGDGAAELLSLSSPVDLLCGPVPSCLPSPELHPDPAPQPDDLIHFEGKTPTPPPPETSTEMDNPAAVPVDTEPGAPGESQVAPEESQVAPEESQVAPEALPTSNKATASTNSPGRKAPRSKIKLAVNFSFTAGP